MSEQRKAPVSIDMKVSVSDGSFEASLNFPIGATAEQINATVKAWLDALGTAVKMASPTTSEQEG